MSDTTGESESQWNHDDAEEGWTFEDDESETPEQTVIEGKRVEGGTEYDEREDELALYEYVGMFAAGLGFFLTPIFTAPVVAYCVVKIRHEKPLTSQLLIALVITTALFWAWVIIFVF